MKKGITLTIAVMAVTIMLILITSSTVIGGSAISAANFEKLNSMLTRTSDNINEYYTKIINKKRLNYIEFEIKK